VDAWVGLRDKLRIAVKNGVSQDKLMELLDKEWDENMVDAWV